MKTLISIAVAIVVLLGAFFALNAYIYNEKQGDGINSFADCEAAGYPILESYPRQCNTPSGKHFVEDIGTTPAGVALGEAYTSNDVVVTPLELVEDSRCPTDVQCIQAGTVRVRAKIESGLGTSEMTLTLGEAITTEAETVTLSAVEPATKLSTVTVAPEEYRFTFTVEKR